MEHPLYLVIYINATKPEERAYNERLLYHLTNHMHSCAVICVHAFIRYFSHYTSVVGLKVSNNPALAK